MRKGIFAFGIMLCAAFMLCTHGVFSNAQPNGDTNGDGKINSRDIAVIQKHLIQMQILPSEKIAEADFNGDGKVNSRDISKLQKYILKVENTVAPLPTATPVPTPNFTID